MKEKEEHLENNSINKVDWNGLYAQERDEILSTPHSIKFECAVPPVEMPDSPEGFTVLSPLLQVEANKGASPMTIALLISALNKYVNDQLKDNDIKEAYDLLSQAMVMFSHKKFNIEEDENDTN